MKKMKRAACLLLSLAMLASAAIIPGAFAEGGKYTTEVTADGWTKITNDNGVVLGYTEGSGVTIIEDDGYAFKDLNKNGKLDAYEDWRLDVETRAADLAARLNLEQAAGMMNLQMDGMGSAGIFSDDVKHQLDNFCRTLAENSSTSVKTSVAYMNSVQAYVEGAEFGIPIEAHAETSVNGCSVWPGNLGIAATFDASVMLERADWYAKEYRALGITTPNIPQIDIASDPRYNRFAETLGEDPQLVTDMAIAFVNGLQSTYDAEGNDTGWGSESINAVIKHFPGDGTNEGGREKHNEGKWGKFNVYPGDNFDTHLIPFTAAMNLDGKTGTAAALMPNYSVAVDEDGEYMGDGYFSTAYNKYMITDLLREEMGFDGVVVTDYMVSIDGEMGANFGTEDWTETERHVLMLETGVDQVSMGAGTDCMIEAVHIYADKYGEDAALERVQTSAKRIIRNIMQIGIFENPYLSTEESEAVVGCAAAVQAGYEAQQKSVVMLKNAAGLIHNTAEETEKPTVYVPLTFTAASMDRRSGRVTPANFSLPVDINILSEYFDVVTDTVAAEYTGEPDENGAATLCADDVVRLSKEELAEVDFALVFVSSPNSSGYDDTTETIIPRSLQYRPYTANSEYVRTNSIAGDETIVMVEDTYGAQALVTKTNNSYYGRTSSTSNERDLDLILDAASKCENVIVAVNTKNPFIAAEFEPNVDSIIAYFDVSNEAVLDIISGRVEPSALLPFQMPADMETVEAQYEDVSRDMECYVDSEGNSYDFAFGMNWSGVINDERVAAYNVPVLEG